MANGGWLRLVQGPALCAVSEYCLVYGSMPGLCAPGQELGCDLGAGVRGCRAVFEAAAQLAPAVVFIDEIDSLAPSR